jgi:hypothetical protein
MTTTATRPPLTAARRALLNRRSLLLAYATAGYNLLEGIVAVAAGAAATSAALLVFRLDSFIEVSSALVVLWQFRSKLPEDRERLALKLIAASFFALAAWISFDERRRTAATLCRARLVKRFRAWRRLPPTGVARWPCRRTRPRMM